MTKFTKKRILGDKCPGIHFIVKTGKLGFEDHIIYHKSATALHMYGKVYFLFDQKLDIGKKCHLIHYALE